MKLLKIFQTKKSPSPDLGPGDVSRTSSSSAHGLSSPVPSDPLMEIGEIRRTCPDNEASSSNSRVKENSKCLEITSADDSDHEISRVLPFNVDPEYKELVDAFKVFDRNGDGKISVGELGEVLRSLGDDISDEDLQLMVDAVDIDGDGFIDLQEFIDLNKVAVDGAGTAARSDELRAAFHVFDVDNNNYISADELHQVLSRLGQQSLTIEECNRMIDGVDADGDGLVDFAEFERMMTDNCVF
ncbi:unnamed protein product [Calypogeia fissa]